MPRSLPRFAASALRAGTPSTSAICIASSSVCVVVRRVVDERHGRLVRERADEVAPADLVLRNAEVDARLVHDPLDDVRRLGPSRARDTRRPAPCS
jgi:hypothetical protein